MDCGTDFVAWKAQWDAYINLSGLADEDSQKQVQALTLCFSHEMLSIGLTKTESKKVDSIIRTIKCYVDGDVNETVERRNLCKCTQLVGESF